jgi:hypothetical protein
MMTILQITLLLTPLLAASLGSGAGYLIGNYGKWLNGYDCLCILISISDQYTCNCNGDNSDDDNAGDNKENDNGYSCSVCFDVIYSATPISSNRNIVFPRVSCTVVGLFPGQEPQQYKIGNSYSCLVNLSGTNATTEIDSENVAEEKYNTGIGLLIALGVWLGLVIIQVVYHILCGECVEEHRLEWRSQGGIKQLGEGSEKEKENGDVYVAYLPSMEAIQQTKTSPIDSSLSEI